MNRIKPIETQQETHRSNQDRLYLWQVRILREMGLSDEQIVKSFQMCNMMCDKAEEDDD